MPLVYVGTGWFIGIALARQIALSNVFVFCSRVCVVVQQILPEPPISLLNSFLLGIDAGLPADMQENPRVTDTSHIIALRGQISNRPQHHSEGY